MVSPTPAALLRTAARAALAPLVGVALGVGAATLVTATTTPTYRATSSVVLIPDQQRPATETGLVDVSLALNLSPSVARLADSREVATAAASALGLPAAAVVGRVVATSEPGSQIITLRVEAGTGPGAARLADAVATATSRQYSALGMAGRSGVTVQVLDAAGVPPEPVSPLWLNLLLGALVGLLAGAVVVALRARSDHRLRGVRQVERRLGLPTLGRIRSLPRWRRSAARTYEVGRVRRFVEATTAALAVYAGDRPQTTILVTAAGPDAPVPMVAALLTHGLAVGGRSSVLVDAHARSAGVDQVVGSRFGTTVDDVLDPANDDTPARMITSAALIDHLGALDAGRVAELLDPLAERTDVLVVAAPPVLAGGSLAELAAHADVVLLVLDSDRVGAAAAARTGLLVGALDVGLSGVLLLGSAVDRDGSEPAAWRSARRASSPRATVASVPVSAPAGPTAATSGRRAGRHVALTPYFSPNLVETETETEASGRRSRASAPAEPPTRARRLQNGA